MKPATTIVDNTAFSAQKLPLEHQLLDPKVSQYDLSPKNHFLNPSYWPEKSAFSTASLRSFMHHPG